MIEKDEVLNVVSSIIYNARLNILNLIENSSNEEEVVIHWKELKALDFVESELIAIVAKIEDNGERS